jgi:hypothetical protein
MLLRTAALLLVFSASTFLTAQPQAAAPPLQTAREALIEMLTGGEKGITRHLTIEVQELLKKPANKTASMMFQAMQQQAGTGMQTFPTGSTLFVINEPSQHKKFEVRVESDDLSGDQDALQLSFHSFHDGQEEAAGGDEWGLMSSRVTVTMQKQQNVWRLSNVGVGIELPLGDPEFLKKMFSIGSEGKATGIGVVAPGVHTDITPLQPVEFDPAGTVMMLGFAERSFANRHPDTGFTCSLSELSEAGKGYGLDPQLASGSFMGYKWSVSGCEGKPAGSFQIIAEPITQGRGAKAVCTDATGNVRMSEDGRGSTCLTSGKLANTPNSANTLNEDSEAVSSWGVDVHVDPPKDKL